MNKEQIEEFKFTYKLKNGFDLITYEIQENDLEILCGFLKTRVENLFSNVSVLYIGSKKEEVVFAIYSHADHILSLPDMGVFVPKGSMACLVLNKDGLKDVKVYPVYDPGKDYLTYYDLLQKTKTTLLSKFEGFKR